eukprot:scaffold923_cov256-Pinguiococcus_pyrenoidosus.AAC.8
MRRGTKLSRKLPCPNWPLLFLPQLRMRPPVEIASECAAPHETDEMPSSGLCSATPSWAQALSPPTGERYLNATRVGVLLSTRSPRPRRPLLPLPQLKTSPPLVRKRQCDRPHATLLIGGRERTPMLSFSFATWSSDAVPRASSGSFSSGVRVL